MSIKVMTQVWESGPESQGELLVMLALADWCDDDGRCWPSMEGIARKARLSDARSARRILRRLEQSGWVEINTGGGRHGCNEYTLKLGPKVPRTESPPDPERTKPGLSLPETRTVEPPEPSRTIREPSEVDQSAPDPTFSRFWEEWPLAKVGKKKAESAFKRLSQANRSEAVRCCRTWAEKWRAKYPGASDLHPTTYLNGRRWEDEFSGGSQVEHLDERRARWRKIAAGGNQ